MVIIGAAGAGIYLGSPQHSTASGTSTTSSSQGQSSSSLTSAFKVSYADLTVGYKGGLFQLGFQDTQGKSIAGIVVILSTPVQAVMCTGGSGGVMSFNSCLPGGGKSYTYSPGATGGFPANTTFTGYDSGGGPGSAIAGQNYPLTITAYYTDNTILNQTISVPAVAG